MTGGGAAARRADVRVERERDLIAVIKLRGRKEGRKEGRMEQRACAVWLGGCGSGGSCLLRRSCVILRYVW